MPSTYVTGESRYVEISAGHVLINGRVLHVNEDFRIENSELVGAPGSDFGDYYVYIRPNRKSMEGYYVQNWEYNLKATTAGGAEPSELPDELCIGFVEKREVAGITNLNTIHLNRESRLINTKDISDEAITTPKLADGAITSAKADSSFARRDVTNIFTANNTFEATTYHQNQLRVEYDTTGACLLIDNLNTDGFFMNLLENGVQAASIREDSGGLKVYSASTLKLDPANDIIDVQGAKVSSLATPATGTDAATKAYVDSITGSTLEVGLILPWAGFTFNIPAGFFLLDGSAQSRSTYSDLFNKLTIPTTANRTSGSAILTNIPSTDGFQPGMPIVGDGIPASTHVRTVDSATQITMGNSTQTADVNATSTGTAGNLILMPYGRGDGATTPTTGTFNLPDMRGRVPVGEDANGTRFNPSDGANDLGETGGSEFIPANSLPNHTHSSGSYVAGPFQTNTNTTIGGSGSRLNFGGSSDRSVSGTSGNPTGTTGESHMPPYQVINYIIKH